MIQMLKRDFQVNSIYSIGSFIFVPLVYMMNGSIIIIYLFALFFFHFYAFYLDDKANIHRFLVSLPIKKKEIVLSKYLFMLISFCIFIVYHIFIDQLAHYGLPYLESDPINGLTLVLILAGVIFALAISLPIYYYSKSFQTAFLIHVSILIFGPLLFVVATANPYIDISKIFFLIIELVEIQPYIMPIIISFGCLFLSYRLSVSVFMRKNLS